MNEYLLNGLKEFGFIDTKDKTQEPEQYVFFYEWEINSNVKMFIYQYKGTYHIDLKILNELKNIHVMANLSLTTIYSMKNMNINMNPIIILIKNLLSEYMFCVLKKIHLKKINPTYDDVYLFFNRTTICNIRPANEDLQQRMYIMDFIYRDSLKSEKLIFSQIMINIDDDNIMEKMEFLMHGYLENLEKNGIPITVLM